jgi:hypothetical protein
MPTIAERIKSWIAPSFQLITIGLLIALFLLVLKQQKDIKNLRSQIDDVQSSLSSEIDDAKDELSSDIDDVKRTVRIWSN